MSQKRLSRRSLLTYGAAGAGLVLAPAGAAAQPRSSFQAARHPEDAWFDALPGRHRVFIDASTVRGAGEALLYANNLYEANKAGYGLVDADTAIVVCMRHFATAFAFNDAVWAKYGPIMATMLEFVDPKTKQPPKTNLLTSAEYGMALPSLGNTIDGVRARGTRFAVCDMATRFFAGQVAGATKGTPDAVYRELTGNMIPDSRMVAAGVVAVNRAQEHGYTLLTTL